jgi:hypothetical protein
MASVTVVKTFGTTGTFSTPQLWEDGKPADLTTAEQTAAGTFAVASFIQGESLTFVGSGATGKFLHTDSTGPGTGTFITYGITTGNPAASDVVTGATSTGTCILSSGTADFVGVVWQGQGQNQEFSGAGTQLFISGSTTSSTAYTECTTVAGASFRDHVNVQTNALQYNASNGCGIRSTSNDALTIIVSEANARFVGLQASATGTGGVGLDANGTNSLVNHCVVEGTYTGVAATAGVYAAFSTSVCSNTVIILRASGGDHVVATGTGSPSFYNVTIVAPDDFATAPTSVFLSGASGTITVQNCGLFAGDSTKAIKAGAATFNFTTCYSDISGTAGVTQTTYGNEFQNVNDATRDFRLKTGAAQIDTGTTDATNAAIDIAKTNRPSGAAYDVGAWELVQAGGGETVITGFGRRMQIVAG